MGSLARRLHLKRGHAFHIPITRIHLAFLQPESFYHLAGTSSTCVAIETGMKAELNGWEALHFLQTTCRCTQLLNMCLRVTACSARSTYCSSSFVSRCFEVCCFCLYTHCVQGVCVCLPCRCLEAKSKHINNARVKTTWHCRGSKLDAGDMASGFMATQLRKRNVIARLPLSVFRKNSCIYCNSNSTNITCRVYIR